MNAPLPVPSHRSPRLGRVLSTALTAVLFSGLALAQLPTPTKTAVATPTDFPNVSGKFEHGGIAMHQYAPNWAPWTFQMLLYTAPIGRGTPSLRGSGIAHNASPLLSESAAAPQGSHVAFLHGLGSATINYTFQPGTWRLRFKAAQRVNGGAPDSQVVRVKIGGTKVFEEMLEGGTYEEYVTEAIEVTSPTTMKVVFKGLSGSIAKNDIALIDRVLLDRVLPWNDPTTWGGSVPTATDDVLVPQYAAVAMDGACVAATVQNEGLLVDAGMDGSLTTRWVLVHQESAQFQVGTEAKPFASDFEVVLTGVNTGESIGHAGTKFLAAEDGGRIDMHGKPKSSWTKLASIDNSGPLSVITVDDATGWEDNDEIVIAYTGYMNHNAPNTHTPRSRRCRIVSINPITGALSLDQSLVTADHCTAPMQTYPANAQPGDKTWNLEQRAEVGMLSHNVRVRSDLLPGSTFGGHVMMIGDSSGEHGRGRFSNVELRELGQGGILARYPMHWHMQHDNGAGQYFRNCSVNSSFNRAVTIHGSNYLTVEDNVCFDQMGHAIFFEDGVEQHNEVHRNLVLFTKRPFQGLELLIHDNELDTPQNRTPAAFWITHPNNHFTGNVAAETVGTGYWFALHNQPTGHSANTEWAPIFGPIDATQAPLGTFDDNVCHSAKSAFDVNDTIRDAPFGQPPHQTPTDPTDDFVWTNRSWDPPAPETINRFVAYGCTLGIYAGLGSNNSYNELVTFDDCVLADNGGNVQLACAFIVRNSLIVHDSGNGVFGGSHGNGFEGGHAQVVYDGPAQMYDCHLVGYDTTAIPSADIFYDNFGAARRHTNHPIAGFTYEGTGAPILEFNTYPNSNPALNSSGVWGVTIQDIDGSLSGGLFPGRTLITEHSMVHVTDGGVRTPDFQIGTRAWLSPYRFGHLQVHHYHLTNQFMTVGKLPTTGFGRKANGSWEPASYGANAVPGPQIRQMPAIVQPFGQPSPGFEYTVELRHGPEYPANPGHSINRVDIVMDDLAAGDVTVLELTFPAIVNWRPNVYLNDGASNNPANWTLLPPNGTAPTVTSYTYSTGTDTVSLRMVNTGLTHRVTLSWL